MTNQSLIYFLNGRALTLQGLRLAVQVSELQAEYVTQLPKEYNVKLGELVDQSLDTANRFLKQEPGFYRRKLALGQRAELLAAIESCGGTYVIFSPDQPSVMGPRQAFEAWCESKVDFPILEDVQDFDAQTFEEIKEFLKTTDRHIAIYLET